MNNYTICNLYSGSGGNSTFISACGKNILIDAGKSAKALSCSLRSIGVDVDDIDAIFVTHEHNDHVSALQTLSHKHNIPIHIQLASAQKFNGLCDKALCNCLVIHKEADFEVSLGEVTVTSFPTPHDSRGSVGYRITFCDGEEEISLAYATDLGKVTDAVSKNLCGCESVVIESNHDPEMLMSGPYPYDLKMRIRSGKGHLSNSDCAALASYLCGNGTKNIMLAHLSEENNTPALAFNETYAAIADDSINLTVACPDKVTWLVGEPVNISK